MATRQSRIRRRSDPYHYYEPPPSRQKSKRRAKPFKTCMVRLLLIAAFPATCIIVFQLLTNFPNDFLPTKSTVAVKPLPSKAEILERLQAIPPVITSQKVSTTIQGRYIPDYQVPPLAGQLDTKNSGISYTYHYSLTVQVMFNLNQVKAEQVTLDGNTLMVQLPKAAILRTPEGRFEPFVILEPRRIKELQSFGESELGVTAIEQSLVKTAHAEAVKQMEAATGYQVKIIAD
jgi:Protein of unknown function (DUF4230)